MPKYKKSKNSKKINTNTNTSKSDSNIKKTKVNYNTNNIVDSMKTTAPQNKVELKNKSNRTDYSNTNSINNNNTNITKNRAAFLEMIKEYGKSFIIALIFVMLFRAFLFEPFKIPSGSMKPTLENGDYIMVSKYTYGYGNHFFHSMFLPIDLKMKSRILGSLPQRGDVIVFKSSDSTDKQSYIKRLIGLPGDTVKLDKSIIYINNEAVKRIDTKEMYKGCDTLLPDFECKKYKEEILQNGNKTSYYVLDAGYNSNLLFPDTTRDFKIPEGHYFFLGDNRNNSKDSRFPNGIGLVPYENIIGKARFVFWNTNMPIKEIYDEIFNKVRLFRAMNISLENSDNSEQSAININNNNNNTVINDPNTKKDISK